MERLRQQLEASAGQGTCVHVTGWGASRAPEGVTNQKKAKKRLKTQHTRGLTATDLKYLYYISYNVVMQHG